MSTLAVFFSPETLFELSIYLKLATEGSLPNDLDSEIIEQPFQHQEWLKRVLGSLRALRIRVAHIALYDVSFTNLVELRIEDICLGYKPLFKRLLRAISSASNLQYLHLANVTIYASQDPDNTPQDIVSDELSISLPNLEQVYLSGMWFNDLEAIFESIVPGNEKWTLCLANYCLHVNVPGIFPEATLQQLGLLIQRFNVNTLILSGKAGENWLDGPQLSQLLKAVPAATTLEMYRWELGRQRWQALTRPQDPSGAGNTVFPCIHNLHIYSSRITDEGGIQSVVTTHRIQQLRLGGFSTSTLGGDSDRRTITNEDDITVWLPSNVADFQLMHGCDVLKSMVNKWCLW